jgi:hypothetical protein
MFGTIQAETLDYVLGTLDLGVAYNDEETIVHLAYPLCTKPHLVQEFNPFLHLANSTITFR